MEINNFNPSDFTKFLFQPFLLKQDGSERLIIVYGSNINFTNFISDKGERSSTVSHIMSFFDVTKTIEFQQPVLEAVTIVDINEFISMVCETDMLVYAQQIVLATGIIMDAIQSIQATYAEYQDALAGIKYVSNKLLETDETDETGENINEGESSQELEKSQDTINTKGSLSLKGDLGQLAKIVFETINGTEGKLAIKDVKKIGEVIKEIVFGNLGIDPNDETAIKKLSAEIEYKIIDALPSNLKAGDIHVNISGILEQIKEINDRDHGSETDLDEQNT